MFYPHYKELDVETTLIKSGDNLIPDLPIAQQDIGLCLVYTEGRNHYAYPITDMSLEGSPCKCHVVYQAHKDTPMQSFKAVQLTKETSFLDKMIATGKEILGIEEAPVEATWVFNKVDYEDK